MAKKVKGLRVSKDLQEKFKFKGDGTSILGDSTESSHEIKGTGSVTGSIEVEGVTTLKERLSGYTFSPPHIDASSELQIVQELIDNAAAMYEGFLVYITNAAAGEPFVQSNKFYFCEDGTWHPSPFSSEIVNYAPELNPTYEISVPADGTDSVPFSLDLPSDLFIDQDGDAMTYTATMTNGNPLPAWLSFDATNTILSGTPTESDIGLLHVLVTATDPSNASGTTTQEIQILAKPVPFWQGATHDFGTSGDPSWITVGAGNLLELNPSSGGSNAWHEAIAPDQFDISGSRTVIEFSTNNWLPSSAGGGDDNKFAVLLRKSSDVDNDFIGMQIHDDGQDDVRIAIAHAGYSGNTWQVTRQHSFSSDSYGPADEETYVDDLKYRLELGTLIPNPASAVHYVLPVMIMAMRKTPPPTVVNAGYGDFTFEQLRDEDQYWAIPASIRDKYFARETYYWSINNSANLPLSEYTTFQPSVWALKDTAVNSPLMNFETFQISQDDIPEVNTDYIFVDWAAMEGQAFSETIPSDLFVDPEGETPLAYVATQDDFSALPSWLTFDPATLTFSGTPAGSDAPGLTVMVRGFDSATEAADQVYGSAGNQKLFTLTVTEAPPTEANPLLPTWTDLDNAPVSGLTNPAHGGAFVTQPDGGLDGSPTSWSSYTSAHTFYARADNDIIDLADAGTDKQLVMEYSFDSPTDACHNYMAIGLEGTNGHTMNWTMQYMVGTYDKQIWLKQNGTNKTSFHNLPFLNNSTEDITSFIFRIVMTPTHWWSNGNIRIAKVHFLGMRKNPEPGIPVLSWTELRDGMLPAWSYYPHYINYESQLGFTENASLPNVEFFPMLSVKSESNSTFSLENVKIFFEDKD
jgi:hypothetical protein